MKNAKTIGWGNLELHIIVLSSNKTSEPKEHKLQYVYWGGGVNQGV